MKKILCVLLLVLALPYATMAVAAEAITGTVIGCLNSNTFVAAVPIIDGVPAADEAVLGQVGLDSNFAIDVDRPQDQYLVVAVDGDRFAAAPGASGPITLTFGETQNQTMLASTTYCYCMKLFWDYYYNQFWTDSGIRWWTISRGCGCICR